MKHKTITIELDKRQCDKLLDLIVAERRMGSDDIMTLDLLKNIERKIRLTRLRAGWDIIPRK